MLQVQLSVDVEARVKAEARAKGVPAESYVQSLIEDAVGSGETRHPRSAKEMEDFFQSMASNSEGIPSLPEGAFRRESFYQDHD